MMVNTLVLAIWLLPGNGQNICGAGWNLLWNKVQSWAMYLTWAMYFTFKAWFSYLWLLKYPLMYVPAGHISEYMSVEIVPLKYSWTVNVMR